MGGRTPSIPSPLAQAALVSGDALPSPLSEKEKSPSKPIQMRTEPSEIQNATSRLKFVSKQTDFYSEVKSELTTFINKNNRQLNLLSPIFSDTELQPTSPGDWNIYNELCNNLAESFMASFGGGELILPGGYLTDFLARVEGVASTRPIWNTRAINALRTESDIQQGSDTPVFLRYLGSDLPTLQKITMMKPSGKISFSQEDRTGIAEEVVPTSRSEKYKNMDNWRLVLLLVLYRDYLNNPK